MTEKQTKKVTIEVEEQKYDSESTTNFKVEEQKNESELTSDPKVEENSTSEKTNQEFYKNAFNFFGIIAVILTIIFIIAQKVSTTNGESFKPWNWPYSFNSVFYLWNQENYIINKNFFFLGLLMYTLITLCLLSILTTICWFIDRSKKYPKMSEDDKNPIGWERFRIIAGHLSLPCAVFVLFICFIYLQFKPTSESWQVIITLFVLMSSIGVAFQIGTPISWGIGLTIAIVSVFALMPQSY